MTLLMNAPDLITGSEIILSRMKRHVYISIGLAVVLAVLVSVTFGFLEDDDLSIIPVVTIVLCGFSLVYLIFSFLRWKAARQLVNHALDDDIDRKFVEMVFYNRVLMRGLDPGTFSVGLVKHERTFDIRRAAYADKVAQRSRKRREAEGRGEVWARKGRLVRGRFPKKGRDRDAEATSFLEGLELKRLAPKSALHLESRIDVQTEAVLAANAGSHIAAEMTAEAADDMAKNLVPIGFLPVCNRHNLKRVIHEEGVYTLFVILSSNDVQNPPGKELVVRLNSRLLQEVKSGQIDRPIKVYLVAGDTHPKSLSVQLRAMFELPTAEVPARMHLVMTKCEQRRPVYFAYEAGSIPGIGVLDVINLADFVFKAGPKTTTFKRCHNITKLTAVAGSQMKLRAVQGLLSGVHSNDLAGEQNLITQNPMSSDSLSASQLDIPADSSEAKQGS